jgi:predicted Co/Zn/Cd cation transporter (cation efflux family)
MKILVLSLLSFLALGSSYNTRALDDVVSIIQLSDGSFDVLCKDHSREIVTKQDLKNENVCPHIAPEKPYTDILFVIDNSGSMNSSQLQLIELVDEIVPSLSQKHSDFQIAVTTTEAWRGEGSDNNGVFKDFSNSQSLQMGVIF